MPAAGGLRHSLAVPTTDVFPDATRLFPVRPRVALLFVLLPAQSLDAKALRAIVTDGFFRGLAAHIANVVAMLVLRNEGLRSTIRLFAGNCLHVCLRLSSWQRLRAGPSHAPSSRTLVQRTTAIKSIHAPAGGRALRSQRVRFSLCFVILTSCRALARHTLG